MNMFFSKKAWIGIAVAALVVGGIAVYCGSDFRPEVLAEVATDPLPDPPEPKSSLPPVGDKQTVPEEKDREPVIGAKTGVDLTDLSPDPNGIGQFNPKNFHECDLPSGNGHFIMDDKAILFTINRGCLRLVVYMGSSLFNDRCKCDPWAPVDEKNSMSRVAYAIKNYGNELTFYMLPLLVIKKEDFNSLLEQIEVAKKNDPNRECSFVLPIDTLSDEIREIVAEEINRRYSDGKKNLVTPDHIQTPDFSDFTLYVKGKAFQGHRGETLGITFTGKPADLEEIIKPVAFYGLPDLDLRVEYRIYGEHIKRNLSVLTIGKLQKIEDIHRYCQNKRAEFNHDKYQHGGGCVVDFMYGPFGFSIGGANKEHYDEMILTCFISEQDLKEFAQAVRTEIREYYDQEFGSEPLSPIEFELKELTTSLEYKVIKINPDGQIENKDILDQYLAQMVQVINDDQDTLNRVKQLIPTQRAPGAIKITADDLLSIDIVRKRFEQGIKIYKLDRKTISDTYNRMRTASTHAFGTYFPVSATAIALNGVTPAEYKQGLVNLESKVSIMSRGIAGTVDSDLNVPTDGKWYFVSANSSGKSPIWNIIELLCGKNRQYCLGHGPESRSTFTITIGDFKYDGKGGVTATMTGMISSNSCCGHYLCKIELSGNIPQNVKPLRTVKIGSVLSMPQASSKADMEDKGAYASTVHEITSAQEKGKFAGSLTSEGSYNQFQKGDKMMGIWGTDKPYLGDYLYADEIPDWYRNAWHAPFEVNVSYEFYDENGVKQVKNVISKNIQLFAEHHFVWVEDTRDRWDKIRGKRCCRVCDACETRYRVGWNLTPDAEISIPFTYEFKPSTLEFTVVGAVGGNAHVRLNPDTKEFEPMSVEDYKNREKQVVNSHKKELDSHK